MHFTTEIGVYTNWSQSIRHIRYCVFVQEQGIAAELEWDDQDDRACFVIARNPANEIVATARFFADGKLGRMAVLRSWRHQGAGSAMLHSVINWARQQGFPDLHLSAQTSAVGFYEKHGFVKQGVPYTLAGIEHQDMRYAFDTRHRNSS